MLLDRTIVTFLLASINKTVMHAEENHQNEGTNKGNRVVADMNKLKQEIVVGKVRAKGRNRFVLLLYKVLNTFH